MTQRTKIQIDRFPAVSAINRAPNYWIAVHSPGPAGQEVYGYRVCEESLRLAEGPLSLAEIARRMRS